MSQRLESYQDEIYLTGLTGAVPDLPTDLHQLEDAARPGCSAPVWLLRMLAWRPRDLDRGYLPFRQGDGIQNYLSDPAFQAGQVSSVDDDLQTAILRSRATRAARHVLAGATASRR